jgi:plasmid stabilization system protein ParE
MKITWSPLAIERVSEIAEYISQDNLSAAQNWVDSIFQAVEPLLSSPQMGRVVPEVGRKEIRELIFGNYRVVFRCESTGISILTIRHGKQILPIEEIPP